MQKPTLPMTAAEVSRLFPVRPFRNIGSLVGQWGTIFTVGFLAAYVDRPAAYVLAALFIGRSQYCLGVLAHDGVHGLLFPNRAWNDFAGKWLCAFPLHFQFHRYRHIHLTHHRYQGTERDPDNHQLSTKVAKGTHGEIYLFLISILTGTVYLTSAVRKTVKLASSLEGPGGGWKERYLPVAQQVLFQISLLAVVHRLGLWKYYGLVWLLPFFTVLICLNQLGAMVQHEGAPGTHEYNASRTVLVGAVERFFFPFNVNYHLEHHLYPSVPWYRLPLLHRRLTELEDYRQRGHFSHGLFNRQKGALAEIVAKYGPTQEITKRLKANAAAIA